MKSIFSPHFLAALFLTLINLQPPALAAALPKCKLSLPIETIVKKGTPYRVARRRALAIGFTVFNHKKDWDKYSKCRYGDGIEMCHRYPEVADCSADGYCAMDFRDQTNTVLRLITHGDENLDHATIDGWNFLCIRPNGKVDE